MSETASTTPSTALSVDSTLAAEVPPHLWLRSGRPLMGTATRVYLTVVLIATALIFVPQGPVYWGLIGGGVLCYFLFPVVIQGLLKPIERRVLTARRREATALLQEVRGRRLVRQYAPHAWLTLQEGRLHLRRGDGKAAARAFAETVRLSRSAGEPALVSAQAQALLIAEQPEQTRELLQALAKKGPLSASDRLHLGLALLAGKGSGRDALEHVQAAAQTLGGHPRVLAALALALHRADETSEALIMLQRAQDALGEEPDPFDEGLVQRGVKLLRTVQKAQQKRERKVEPATARVAGAVPVKAETKGEAKLDAKAVEEKAKSARRVKKDERRAARRAAKAEKRTQPESAKAKKVKAAKVKPAGKVATVAGKVTAGAGKVVETTPAAVKGAVETPVAKVEAKAVEVKPAAVKVVETPVKVEAKVVEAPVKVEAKVVEAPVKVEAKVVEAPVKVETPVKVEAKVVETPVVKAAARAVETTPIAAKVERPEMRPGAAAGPSGARPAPPAGTALFGSLGAVSGPQSGAQAGLGLPRAPLAGTLPLGGAGQGEAVPKTMSGEVTAPVPKAMPTASSAMPIVRPPAPAVASNPIVRPAAPSSPIVRPAAPANPIVRPAAPAVASNPIVRPAMPSTPVRPAVPVAATPAVSPVVRPPVPVLGGAPSPTPAAVVSAAPAPVQAPRVVATPAPALPPRPAAPVLPPAPVAVVLPSAPVAAAAATRPSELAQVLPDTDDAWDDMLNALEADGPSSPA